MPPSCIPMAPLSGAAGSHYLLLMLLKFCAHSASHTRANVKVSLLGSRGSCKHSSNASKRDSETVVYSSQWDSARWGNCSLLPMVFHDWSSQVKASCSLTLWKTSSADWSPRIHYPESPTYLVVKSETSLYSVQYLGAPTNCDRGLERVWGQQTWKTKHRRP